MLGPALGRHRDWATLLVAPTWNVGAIGVALGAIALAWSIVAQAADGAGLDTMAALADGLGAGSPLAVLLGSTRFGQVAIGRACGLVLLAVAMASTRDALRARPDQARGRRRWAVATMLGAIVPVTVSLNSHGAAQPLASGALGADWLHVVAMGAWVGGLVSLTLTVTRARAVLADGAVVRSFASAMVERFSPLAACVGVVALSGAWQAWVLVGSVDALLGTPHGWALLLKLALVGALLAVAAVNAIYTRPALAREAALARASGVPAPGAVAVLEAVSGVVEVLMMGVLLVSGALTQLPPAREAFAEATRGTFRDVTADGVRLRLRLNPGRPGYNVATLWAIDRSGPLPAVGPTGGAHDRPRDGRGGGAPGAPLRREFCGWDRCRVDVRDLRG